MTLTQAILFVLGFESLVALPLAFAGITGSPHDFSAKAWSGGEICVACHTPHRPDTSLPGSPLWNHEVSLASYQLYSSASLNQTPGQPGVYSKMCLSCHDGTVAISSFGQYTGTEFVTGAALVGTDLSNDHPIGISMYHSAGLSCGNCHSLHPFGFVSVLPFFDGKVECATCHDVHNQRVADAKMLRKSRSGSAICQHCHAK